MLPLKGGCMNRTVSIKTTQGLGNWLNRSWVRFLLGAGVLLIVSALFHGTAWSKFPSSWVVGHSVETGNTTVSKWITNNWYNFFQGVTHVLYVPLHGFESFLLWFPWWLVLAAVTLIAWRIMGRKGALWTLAGLAFLDVMGLYTDAIQTLALTGTATFLAIVLGLPVGIASARSDRIEGMVRPVLDFMQTMPSFVYLIPVIMLLGLGAVPGMLATLVYAIPPMIRLTNLGIRQVDPDTVEAARSFGATSRQLLLKVQLPMAMPSIMTGVNQTVMMALAMVVIASMVAAPGLGMDVFRGIGDLNVGLGAVGGLGIVFLAILIDRITQSFAKQQSVVSSRD